MINPITLAKLTVLVIMISEWFLLAVTGPYILREPANMTKRLITRMIAVLVIWIVILVQNYLYHTIGPAVLLHAANDHFLSIVYLVQHLVGFFILLKVAFKLRTNS